jgi:hypothetical protein
MASRVKKIKPIIELLIPDPTPEIDSWLVMGVDPSLSASGYAIARVDRNSDPIWTSIGSVRPDKTSDPSWIRSLSMGQFLLMTLLNEYNGDNKMGLIVSFEAPTMGNDYLNTANKVMHTVIFGGDVNNKFPNIKIQHTNASTLRSLLGLVKRGAKNKKENKDKAWTYIDKAVYPSLDNDACDGVLLAMMGVWTAKILLGESSSVPEKVLTKLTDKTLEHKGKGKNAYTQLAGTLHREEYFTSYTQKEYQVAVKDAKSTAARLPRYTFQI